MPLRAKGIGTLYVKSTFLDCFVDKLLAMTISLRLSSLKSMRYAMAPKFFHLQTTLSNRYNLE